MSPKREQFLSPGEGRKVPGEKKEKDAVDRCAGAILRVVERNILSQRGESKKMEQEISSALQDMPPEKKAVRIYESFIAHALEKQAERKKPEEERTAPDPYFVSEFKQLWNDENARQIFLERFIRARIDFAEHRISDLGSNLKEIESALLSARGEYARIKQDLNLQRIKKPTEKKAARSKLGYLDRRIEGLSDSEARIVNLEGYDHIQENTDTAALVMYETLKRYQQEAEEGFVWLPSRREIHRKIDNIIERTGRAPLLIGPPGTGKTTQVDAIARERTGEGAVRIPCRSNLSTELIAVQDIKKGEGAYDYRGTVTEAATGYKHSLAEGPEFSHGRIANFDEISQLDPVHALAIIKDILLKKTGQPFDEIAPYDVLPGFHLTATTNVPIADERLEREFARIPTNYFEMTPENPELYEFMLAKLLYQEGHFPLIDKNDVGPAYEREEAPEDERTVLENGSIVIAQETLIENPADRRHGFLYRFANAIRAIQDSYIHGSQFNEKNLANTAVYEDYDSEGNIMIKGYVTDLEDKTQFPGGQMLKLKSGSSTITAEMISKWADGFTQSQERDLPNWMRSMLREHITQTSPEDAERIQAIADHFHLFEETEQEGPIDPLTPKEIGYLSPRVPRPLEVELPQQELPAEEEELQSPQEKYEATQVLLEDGTRVLINKEEGDIKNEKGEVVASFDVGENIRIDIEVGEEGKEKQTIRKDFIFAGIIESETSENNGKPVIMPADGEELYRISSAEEIDMGILTYFNEAICGETGIDDLKEELIDYWESEGCKEQHGAFSF